MTGNWLLGMTKRALGMTKRGVGLGMTKSGEDSDVDGQAILWLRRHLHDRSDLDRARPRGRNACRDRGRLIQVLRVDDVVAAELLARLREGAVGRQGFAVADPDGRRGRDRLEGVAGEVFPALLDALGEGTVLLVDGALVLLVEGLPVHLTVVNQKHVSHRSLLSSPSCRTGGPRNDARWVPFLSGETAPAQKFLSDPGGSADPGLRGGLQQVFLAKYHDGPAAPRQGGVEELT